MNIFRFFFIEIFDGECVDSEFLEEVVNYYLGCG